MTRTIFEKQMLAAMKLYGKGPEGQKQAKIKVNKIWSTIEKEHDQDIRNYKLGVYSQH